MLLLGSHTSILLKFHLVGVRYQTVTYLGHQKQEANNFYFTQQALLFKIGHVCEIPIDWGGYRYLARSLHRWLKCF